VPTHIALGRSVGLDEAKLAALGEEAPTSLTEVEQVVVTYARRLTRLDPIDDALFQALQRHFSLTQIMELCFTIGVACAVNRFHATFHTPLDRRTREAMSAGAPLPLPPEPTD
jgi:alkylhydroperoxidase family enzyme